VCELQSVLALARTGVWDRLLDAVSKRYDGDIVMIDSSCVRVHQHGANAKKGTLPILAWDIHAAA
jgi:transposase